MDVFLQLVVPLSHSREHFRTVNFVWALVFAEEGHPGGLDEPLAVLCGLPPVHCLHSIPAGDVPGGAADELPFVHFQSKICPTDRVCSTA